MKAKEEANGTITEMFLKIFMKILFNCRIIIDFQKIAIWGILSDAYWCIGSVKILMQLSHFLVS